MPLRTFDSNSGPLAGVLDCGVFSYGLLYPFPEMISQRRQSIRSPPSSFGRSPLASPFPIPNPRTLAAVLSPSSVHWSPVTALSFHHRHLGRLGRWPAAHRLAGPSVVTSLGSAAPRATSWVIRCRSKTNDVYYKCPNHFSVRWLPGSC